MIPIEDLDQTKFKTAKFHRLETVFDIIQDDRARLPKYLNSINGATRAANVRSNSDSLYAQYWLEGVECELTYTSGNLTSAIIKFKDNVAGIDLTEKIKTIPNIPRHIVEPQTLVIRGTLIIYKADRIAVDSPSVYEVKNKPYASRVYDILLNEKSGKSDINLLKFYATNYLPKALSLPRIERERILVDLGFNTPKSFTNIDTKDDLFAVVDDTKRSRSRLTYSILGLVIVANYPEAARKLLPADSRDPIYWGVRYSLDRDPIVATIDKITWTNSYTGELIPTVHFAKSGKVQIPAIELANSTILRVGIGEGAEVQLIVDPESKNYSINKLIKPVDPTYPDTCPSCKSPTNMRSNGTVVCCSNPDCHDTFVEWLTHVGSTDIPELGLTREIVEDLVNSGTITKFEDVFVAQQNKSTLPDSRFMAIISRFRSINLFELLLITSAGGVGRGVASKLTIILSSFARLKECLNNQDELDKLTVSEFTKNNLRDWYAHPRHKEIIEHLSSYALPRL